MPICKQRTEVIAMVDPTTGQPLPSPDKPYLLLLIDEGAEDLEAGTFQVFHNRRDTFEFLTSTLGNYDLVNSYVLSGKLQFGSEVSIYSFLRMCMEKNYFPDHTEFTVEDLTSYLPPDLWDDNKLAALYRREIGVR